MYRLAQFPLALVVFPGQTVPLHIFEPRYRELIRHCREDGISFGMLPVIDDTFKQIGTKVHLIDVVKEYDDGRLDVKIQGHSLFRLVSYEAVGTHAYPEGEVEDLDVASLSSDIAMEDLEELVAELYQVMRINKNVHIDAEDLYLLAHRIGLDIRDQYELLCCLSVSERCIFLSQKLRKLIPKIRKMEEIRRRIELNGQFQPT